MVQPWLSPRPPRKSLLAASGRGAGRRQANVPGANQGGRCPHPAVRLLAQSGLRIGGTEVKLLSLLVEPAAFILMLPTVAAMQA